MNRAGSPLLTAAHGPPNESYLSAFRQVVGGGHHYCRRQQISVIASFPSSVLYNRFCSQAMLSPSDTQVISRSRKGGGTWKHFTVTADFPHHRRRAAVAKFPLFERERKGSRYTICDMTKGALASSFSLCQRGFSFFLSFFSWQRTRNRPIIDPLPAHRAVGPERRYFNLLISISQLIKAA